MRDNDPAFVIKRCTAIHKVAVIDALKCRCVERSVLAVMSVQIALPMEVTDDRVGSDKDYQTENDDEAVSKSVVWRSTVKR